MSHQRSMREAQASQARDLLRVFISGTFEDMEEWRESARKHLLGLGLHPVDLSVKFATSELTVDLINDHLDEAEVYLGVYGLRYGSRVNDAPQAPSWTHYEFDRFKAKLEAHIQAYKKIPMCLMHPSKDSEAYKSLVKSAAAVNRRLPRAARAADRAAQQAFLEYIRGGTPKDVVVPVPADGDWAEATRLYASRITGTFRNKDDFEKLIGCFVWTLAHKDFSDVQPAAEAPPQADPEHELPAGLLRRLAPDPLPPAMCVLVSRSKAPATRELSAALARANPWDVEDPDEHIDLTGERLDVPEEEKHYEVLRILAAKLRVDLRSERPLAALVADRIVEDEERRMIRIDGLERINAHVFIEEVWAPLEAEMRSRHASSRGTVPSLLLIVSDDTVMRASLRQRCRLLEDAAPADYRQPLCVTPNVVAGPPSQERDGELPEGAPA